MTMPEPFRVCDLKGTDEREALLRVGNASARETSHLSADQFDRLIDRAGIALIIPPAQAFLIAFQNTDGYDGGHFLWFGDRFDRFVYIDRVVVADHDRRRGLGRMLYAETFERAARMGHTRVVCEVNVEPPNPVSDRFHAELGFAEVGRATIGNGAKTVRYLSADIRPVGAPKRTV